MLKPVPQGATLSLAEIVDIALSNNPDTRTTWLEARAAEAGVGSARATYFPELDVLAGVTRSRSSAEGATASTTIAPSLFINNVLDHQHLLKGAFFSNASWEEPRNVILRVDVHL